MMESAREAQDRARRLIDAEFKRLERGASLPKLEGWARRMGIKDAVVQEIVTDWQRDGRVAFHRGHGYVKVADEPRSVAPDPGRQGWTHAGRRLKSAWSGARVMAEVRAMPEHAWVSPAYLADRFGVSWDTGKKALEGALEEGRVERKTRNYWVRVGAPVRTPDEPARPSVKVEQVKDRLRTMLPGMGHNERLPTHRDLAAMCNTSVQTVLTAVNEFAEEEPGVIQSRGRGPYGGWRKIGELEASKALRAVEDAGQRSPEIPAYDEGLPAPKVEQVKDRLREMLPEMELGDRFPPLSELEERFGVSDSTVSRAQRELAEEHPGVIDSRGGREGSVKVGELPEPTADASDIEDPSQVVTRLDLLALDPGNDENGLPEFDPGGPAAQEPSRTVEEPGRSDEPVPIDERRDDPAPPAPIEERHEDPAALDSPDDWDDLEPG